MYTEASREPLLRSQQFAAVLTAVGCARAFVQQTVRAWQLVSIRDDAVLVASELVTNAVRSTGNTDPHPDYAALARVPVIRVQLGVRDRLLLVEVWDPSTEPPVLQGQRDGAEHGRGLHIVHVVSERWGVYFPKSGGKVVWAALTATHAHPPDRLSDAALPGDDCRSAAAATLSLPTMP
ncbi:ATP-binding protein [Actinocrinis puniceicyclus]|uniref:ATP-binding protein n=1 Tax=Actinocrinis puniceicyclus TaxID=977794 RepID=A0A8J7WSG9_9ACTN|nr:ATP-binding protein [Actinocrinis puniceicyclus]MBS2965637.1 ATP-binding protein [Actinocrinis puniceicyclus]